MAKISIEIEKAKGGGYIMWRDGELAFAASSLFELYETLGHDLRTAYGDGVHRPHATVQRRIAEDAEEEMPAPRAAPRKVAEPPPVRPTTYSVPVPRPRTDDLVKDQLSHVNGHTTGLADRVPAVG